MTILYTAVQMGRRNGEVMLSPNIIHRRDDTPAGDPTCSLP